MANTSVQAESAARSAEVSSKSHPTRRQAFKAVAALTATALVPAVAAATSDPLPGLWESYKQAYGTTMGIYEEMEGIRDSLCRPAVVVEWWHESVCPNGVRRPARVVHTMDDLEAYLAGKKQWFTPTPEIQRENEAYWNSLRDEMRRQIASYEDALHRSGYYELEKRVFVVERRTMEISNIIEQTAPTSIAGLVAKGLWALGATEEENTDPDDYTETGSVQMVNFVREAKEFARRTQLS